MTDWKQGHTYDGKRLYCPVRPASAKHLSHQTFACLCGGWRVSQSQEPDNIPLIVQSWPANILKRHATLVDRAAWDMQAKRYSIAAFTQAYGPRP